MIKKIIDSFKNLDEQTIKIIKIGLKFCFILCAISCIILLTYNNIIASPLVYYIGIAVLKLSFYFGADFIVCGFIIDNIKKQII